VYTGDGQWRGRRQLIGAVGGSGVLHEDKNVPALDALGGGTKVRFRFDFEGTKSWCNEVSRTPRLHPEWRFSPRAAAWRRNDPESVIAVAAGSFSRTPTGLLQKCGVRSVVRASGISVKGLRSVARWKTMGEDIQYSFDVRR